MRIRVRVSDSPPSIRVSIFSYKLDKFFVSWNSSQFAAKKFTVRILRTVFTANRELTTANSLQGWRNWQTRWFQTSDDESSSLSPCTRNSSQFAVRKVRSFVMNCIYCELRITTVNFSAAVAQQEDALVLETRCWRFNSFQPYQNAVRSRKVCSSQ